MSKLPACYCPECEECIGYVGRFFAFMFNKFHRCRRKHNMSAVDFSASVAEAVRAAALVASATAELSAATANAAQLTQLQAENATLQAQVASLQGDLSTSQASEVDLAAKLKAANDALAAALPAA